VRKCICSPSNRSRTGIRSAVRQPDISGRHYPSLPERGINVPVFLIEVYEGNEARTPALSDFVVESASL